MSRFFALIILNVLIIAAYVNAAPSSAEETETTTTTTKKPCEEVCQPDLNKVCGYDGNCYKEYPNKCRYDYVKCSERSNLETVDISLCELAEKDNHPSFKICSN